MKKDILERRGRVALLLLAGKPAGEIAEQLGVSESTIRRDTNEIARVVTRGGERPESLVTTVREAIGAMGWVKDTDQAIVDLALTYAWRIDEAIRTGDDQDVTKALYLGPHLTNALRELGGTPSARQDLRREDHVGNKLAELRSIRGGKAMG